MKCPKCGSKAKKQTGKVYGQPNQVHEFQKCSDCGLEFNNNTKGLRVYDEVDMQMQKEKDKKSASGSS